MSKLTQQETLEFKYCVLTLTMMAIINQMIIIFYTI